MILKIILLTLHHHNVILQINHKDKVKDQVEDNENNRNVDIMKLNHQLQIIKNLTVGKKLG